MRRFKTLIGLSVLLTFGCASIPAGEASPAQENAVRLEARKTVLVLQQHPTQSARYCGSAVPIAAHKGKNGRYAVLFLTAKHVLDQSTKTRVVWQFPGDPRKHFARVDLSLVRRHLKWDAATFVVAGLPEKFAATVRISDKSPTKGDWILSSGFANCESLVMHSGTVKSRGMVRRFGPCWLTDAKVLGGMSGGGVFDVRGKLVGITVAKSPTGGHFALAVDVLKQWLPKR